MSAQTLVARITYVSCINNPCKFTPPAFSCNSPPNLSLLRLASFSPSFETRRYPGQNLAYLPDHRFAPAGLAERCTEASLRRSCTTTAVARLEAARTGFSHRSVTERLNKQHLSLILCEAVSH